MESKLNLIAIQEYSDELAEIFLNELQGKKKDFSGKEILELNEVKQVNMFILRQIFFSWMEQNENLKSPYFDFENPKVNKALKDLMNLLSHNIQVPFEMMQGLYSTAICDTILFYLVPDYFLIHFFNDLDDSLLNIKTLKQLKSYIDLNQKMYSELLEKLETEGIDPSDRQALQKAISSITYDAEEKDIFDFFSSKKELDVELFLNIEEEKVQEKKPEDLKEGKRFEFDNEKIVHEKYKTDQETLNDKLKGGKTPSLVDNMQKQKVKSIANSVSLNQRFIFVKELFGGNLDNYQKALNTLDTLSTWEEANEYIEDKIAPEFNWDISKDSVAEFTEIIQRKFQ